MQCLNVINVERSCLKLLLRQALPDSESATDQPAGSPCVVVDCSFARCEHGCRVYVLVSGRNCGLPSQFLPLDVVLKDCGGRGKSVDGTDR